MFAVVMTAVMTIERPGLPSFLAKVLRHAPSTVVRRKTEYQNM